MTSGHVCPTCYRPLGRGLCEACRERPAFVIWHGRGYWEIELCAVCWLRLPEEDRDLVCHLIDHFEADDLTRGSAGKEAGSPRTTEYVDSSAGTRIHGVPDATSQQPPARDLFDDSLLRSTSALFDALEGC
jgi:hypothetical protein